eukprot:jgi/Ulvmu1/7508/UM037_0052.1
MQKYSPCSGCLSSIDECHGYLKAIMAHTPNTYTKQIVRKFDWAKVPQVRRQRFNVLLTTYDFLINKKDAPRFAAMRWTYLILDEGHRIKNTDCQLSQVLRTYKIQHRLLLTGTPVHNKLLELWSLLHFLMPDIFSSAEEFQSWFDSWASPDADGQAGTDAARAAQREEQILIVTNRLHQVLRPFVLRRTKDILNTTLPPKTERAIPCPTSLYQREMLALLTSKERMAAVKGVNNVVMECRKVCNEPLLSKLHVPGVDASLKDMCMPATAQLGGKVAILLQLLHRLRSLGHKTLIFSTMTMVLDSIEEVLEYAGVRYTRLDGNTKASERGAILHDFTSDSEIEILLLSVRSGGVGLNLQAADTIIMIDTDWNPQMDKQAQARVHRLGQTKPVLILRLFIPGTVEEHILQVSQQKQDLADAAITGGFFDGKTSASERQSFLVELIQRTKQTESEHQVPSTSQEVCLFPHIILCTAVIICLQQLHGC